MVGFSSLPKNTNNFPIKTCNQESFVFLLSKLLYSANFNPLNLFL